MNRNNICRDKKNENLEKKNDIIIKINDLGNEKLLKFDEKNLNNGFSTRNHKDTKNRVIIFYQIFKKIFILNIVTNN